VDIGELLNELRSSSSSSSGDSSKATENKAGLVERQISDPPQAFSKNIYFYKITF